MSCTENWEQIRALTQEIPLPAKESEVFLFGAGLVGALAASTLKDTLNLIAVCDNSTAKQGTVMEGLPCIPPDELTQYRNPFVLISTNKYYKSVHQQLEEMKIPHCSLDAYVVHNHFQEFEEVFRALDETSKTVYSGVLLGRMTGDMDRIEQYCCDNQYFCLPKFRYLSDPRGVFVNCGAYVGDTLERFVENSLGTFSRIYAFEPNGRVFGALQKRAALLKDLWALTEDQIVCEQKGVGRRNECLYFRDFSQNLNASLTVVQTECTDSVDIVSLDEYLKQKNAGDVAFINADIEGFEWDMLHGAQETIQRNKPKLAICIYHNIFDLFRIQLYLQKLVPEYQFHICHHSNTDEDTVLYCHV